MKRETIIAVVGDVHGHLQLACCMLARWQRELGVMFEAAFLCGDVGTFTDSAQLDSATRAHAKRNPCELEFLHQWSTVPQAPWLDYIFLPEDEGGLGLGCPVVMVHGNHEGFSHLESLVPPQLPDEPLSAEQLPGVDTNGNVRYLPSGWRLALPSGYVVAGVGGIDEGQRRTEYHPLAYVDEQAVHSLLDEPQVDLLVTHQGPSGLQGDKGSQILQHLLAAGKARCWAHGHSILSPDPTRLGPKRSCLVVPLGDIAFHVPKHEERQSFPYEVGRDGWGLLKLRDHEVEVMKQVPAFFREFRRTNWISKDGLLIPPSLAHIAWQT